MAYLGKSVEGLTDIFSLSFYIEIVNGYLIREHRAATNGDQPEFAGLYRSNLR